MPEQGFVISENLRESGSGATDSRILDNLGGEGTSGNFQLFSGNLRRESIIPANNYSYSGGFYTSNTENGYVAFSNRTTVKIRDGNTTINTGTVSLSNGIDTFQILDANNDPIAPGGAYDLVRSDAVTFENLSNLNPVRLSVSADADQDTIELIGDGGGERNIFELRSISDSYRDIDSALSVFFFRQSKLPLSYQDTFFTQQINMEGYLRIVNDDLVPRGPTSPGIFVVKEGTPSRAFSSEDNPWTESGGVLTTTATNATVGTLTATDPVFTTSSVNADAGTFTPNATFKLPVEIFDENGVPETYYLLLEES